MLVCLSVCIPVVYLFLLIMYLYTIPIANTPIHNRTLTATGESAPVPSPALFVGVDGAHAHDNGSPSFYNLAEAGEVARIVSDGINHLI